MTRCLFVATDDSPDAQSALRYALDFAAALRIGEIACLCVHEEYRSQRKSFSPAVVGAEAALGTAHGGVMLLDEPEWKPRPPLDPDAVLDNCSRHVAAAGFRFTPVCGSGVPSDVMAGTAHMGEAVFLGRNSDDVTVQTSHLGFTASNVLQRIRQTTIVCPATHARIERLILALAVGPGDAELVARAAMWGNALKVPVHVAVARRSLSDQALQAAQHVLANEHVETTGETYVCRPEQFVETLRPTDLILVARHRPWRVLDLWFGSRTDRIVEYAPGPVAVIAP